MSRIYLLLVLLTAMVCAFANDAEIYSLVRVPWGFEGKVPSEITSARPGVWAEFAIPEGDLALLRARAVPFEVRIPDMAGFYASRLDDRLDMGGWRTYEMIYAALDSLHAEFPEFVSEPESIGAGWNGYIIKAVKISDNVSVDEGEPEVLINGGIHSREVIAPEIVLTFARWLLDSMATSEVARHIVEKRETWIAPLLNPDGYMQNQTTNPTGGGMWRKNRRNNGDGTWGVDLNRNFPYMWGNDDIGSSPSTNQETYRGPFEGSEPETQAIMEFYNSREFRSSLSFHSYSNYYLFPWGWTYDLPEHNEWFLRVGFRYTRGNGYLYGPSATTIYITNGDADDWVYGATDEHPWVFVCTPEVGGDSDGFWPPISRKAQLVSENMPSCKVCCQIAGAAPFMTAAWIDPFFGDSSGYADPGERSRILVEVENLGRDPSWFYAKAIGASAGVSFVNDSAWGGEMASEGYDTLAFVFEIDEAVVFPGDNIKIVFEIRDTSGYVALDSTSFTCGTPMVLSEWDFETSTAGFTGSGDWEWGIPTGGPDRAFSGFKLWATKLGANYTDDRLSELLLPAVSIPDSTHRPRLQFAHWFSFEPPSGGDIYDGGTVMLSSDGGVNWRVISPLGGYDGVAYSYNDYVGGDSVFTGSSGGWRTETFELEPYSGTNVLVKLVFGSDPYVSAAGWFVDDIRFVYYLEPGMAAGSIPTPSSMRYSIFPNPFNSACRIEFDCDLPRDARIDIFDISGKLVRGFEGKSALWDGKDNEGDDIPTGVYLARFTSGNRVGHAKVSIIK